jgi:hypothetical protein
MRTTRKILLAISHIYQIEIKLHEILEACCIRTETWQFGTESVICFFRHPYCRPVSIIGHKGGSGSEEHNNVRCIEIPDYCVVNPFPYCIPALEANDQPSSAKASGVGRKNSLCEFLEKEQQPPESDTAKHQQADY